MRLELLPQRPVGVGDAAVVSIDRQRGPLDAHLFDFAGIGDVTGQKTASGSGRLFQHSPVQDLATIHHREEGKDLEVSVLSVVAEVQQLMERAYG